MRWAAFLPFSIGATSQVDSIGRLTEPAWLFEEKCLKSMVLFVPIWATTLTVRSAARTRSLAVVYHEVLGKRLRKEYFLAW